MAKKQIIKKAAKIATDIVKGGKAGGKVVEKVVKTTSKVISKHPQAATRVGGALTAMSGIKDIKAYKNTRETGTLLKGIAKTVLGTGLLIFNGKEWYLKNGPVTPAMNDSRPMNPLLTQAFNQDPTYGSVIKMFDLNVNWDSIEGSLAFQIATTKMMEAIRENLKSNLPYSVEFVREYLTDSIALAIVMSQLSRQLTFYRYNTTENPDFYKLWNKVTPVVEGYGPVTLRDLSHYSSDEQIASTIAIYDTLVSSISNTLRLPVDLAKWIAFYFANVFTTDSDDSNCQYISVRINNIQTRLGSPRHELTTVNVYDLNPSNYTKWVAEYATKYSVIAADMAKAGIGTSVGFQHFNDLQPAFVYSPEFMQACINAYTNSDYVVQNDYVRLDLLPECKDDLTTYLFLGALQDHYDPLYTPTLRTLSMVAKVQSNNTLNWEEDLFQGSFDTSKDFGIMLSTDIYADTYVNINNGRNFFFDNDSEPPADFGNGGVVISTTASDPVGISVGYEAIEENQFLYIKMFRTLVDDSPSTFIYAKKTFDGTGAFPTTVYVTSGEDIGLCAVRSDAIEGELELDQSFNGQNNVVQFASISVDVMAPGRFDPSDQHYRVHTINVSLLNTQNTKRDLNLSGSDNEYIKVDTTDCILEDFTSLLSINSLYGTAEEAVVTAQVTDGFSNLAGYMVDQMDYHIPIMNTKRVTVDINGREEYSHEIGSSLLKEPYIPVFYNVRDLNSILYNMFFSLLM